MSKHILQYVFLVTFEGKIETCKTKNLLPTIMDGLKCSFVSGSMITTLIQKQFWKF